MASPKRIEDKTESHEDRFLKAFEDYNDALFRHAVIRVSDREKAIDIVHDTFTKVWTYIRSGHDIDSYRSFLYKVLNNLIIDSYRKQREVSLDALFEIEGVDEGSFAGLSENSAEALAATIDGRKAFELLSELPDVYREVLTFRFVDGLGPKEISDLTEETENAVSVRIYRGLKMLRDKMESEVKKTEKNRKNNNEKI